MTVPNKTIHKDVRKAGHFLKIDMVGLIQSDSTKHLGQEILLNMNNHAREAIFAPFNFNKPKPRKFRTIRTQKKDMKLANFLHSNVSYN